MARTPAGKKSGGGTVGAVVDCLPGGIEFIAIPALFISFITESDVIHKIMEHLNLWEEKVAEECHPGKDSQKIPRAVFHAIRHLTASILGKNNVPLVDIQAILRHQRLSTTEKYILHYDQSDLLYDYCPEKRNPPKKKGLQLMQL